MRMRSNAVFYFKTVSGVLILIIYCEYIVYYAALIQCGWPSLDPKHEDPSVEKSIHQEDPVRVMILTDTHLLGTRNGHWFDKLRREWQMYRAFQTAMTLHRPELVFVLGDLTDEGLYCSNEEFDYYVRRFHTLFAVPEGTKMYVAVGNHDIGFHYRVTPYLNQRFVNAFNAPPVQLISLRGNHFVIVNSMALEGDGCKLCKPTEEELKRIAKILECSKDTHRTKQCDPKERLEHYSRPILMQHYPLYRPSDMECNDSDAAPLPIRKERFRERWECLSREATTQLLDQIKPRLSLSGHTHHGCTRPLPTGDGLEITIPCFSWRNKNNPNYGLAVVTSNNYAFAKCEMPREGTVIGLYIFGGSMLLAWIIYGFYSSRRNSRYKMIR